MEVQTSRAAAICMRNPLKLFFPGVGLGLDHNTASKFGGGLPGLVDPTVRRQLHAHGFAEAVAKHAHKGDGEAKAKEVQPVVLPSRQWPWVKIPIPAKTEALKWAVNSPSSKWNPIGFDPQPNQSSWEHPKTRRKCVYSVSIRNKPWM